MSVRPRASADPVLIPAYRSVPSREKERSRLDPSVARCSQGFGEFARAALADRVHVFWIVDAAERSAACRLGRDELNISDGRTRQ